ncbi:MAG: bifunctional DNA primase/polymerase [Anaerolineae bacterium]|nr:bifunctional DNA primase/polymerase [Anaerolineae bacterium]
MSTFYESALTYLARGWSVFPLQPRMKEPFPGFPLKEYQREKRADEAKLQKWWVEHFPDANIGLCTGTISGFFVLDVDGISQATDMFALDDLPATLTVETGRGFHLYFQLPDFPVGNRAGLLPNVDIRGDGGYVVAPPSIHPSGESYRWVDPGANLSPAPAWLLDMLRPQPTPERATAEPLEYANRRGGELLEHYATAALRNEIDAVASAGEGTRNDSLYIAAQNLGQLVGSGALAQGQVEGALLAVATNVGLPTNEATKTIASGLGDGMTKPRKIELKAPGAQNGNGHKPAGDPPPAATKPAEQPATNDEERLNFTDLGNAKRLVKRYGDRVRFVYAWGKWLVWDGTRWAVDDTGSIMRAAKDTVMAMYREASEILSDRSRQSFVEWTRKSESAGKLSAMIDLAKTEKRISIRPESLDANNWLLNCRNGVIDLRTFEFREHDPQLLITKRVNVDYDKRAKCPTWVKFIRRVMNNDDEMVDFIQRALGYTLTGDVGEQCLFFMIGTGRNGKSTFIETLISLMSEYTVKLPTESLMARAGTGIPNEIARMKGMRLVVARETDENQRLAEATVKDLTGGDTITARFLNQEWFDFKPTHKLWMYGNHKPLIKGTDAGIWRRIRLVPFTVTIPVEERDPSLPFKLEAEMSGILNWILEGCRKWQQSGLGDPRAVKHATAEYREEMDVLAEYLSERTTTKPDAKITAKTLYADYSQWCDEMGEKPLSQRTLGLRLKERGFSTARETNTRYWTGIILRTKDISHL